jgi:hypothetical protein
MRPWLVVWLVIALTTTVALGAILFFLVRQVMLIGRTASRMQRELGPITDEIAAASARASDTAAGLSTRGPDRRRGRR